MTLRSEEMVVQMGPQHPSTHGVLRLEITTDGEIVRRAVPHIGYLHRCFEKCCEGVLWSGAIPYTDRMDYLAAMSQEWALVAGIERLHNVVVPERAEHIRVIVAELQRIASHFVSFGTYGIDMGAVTPFLHAFRDREKVLDIFERLSGARLLYNYIRVGGVLRDLDELSIEMTRAFVTDLRTRIPEYHQLLSYNKIFCDRTCGVGVIDAPTCLSYNITGPNLRAAGVNWDLRRDDPYGVYDRFQWNVAVGTAERGVLGDCWNRYMVRLLEIEESLDIISQALDALPVGDHIKAPRILKPPAGEIYMRQESPRGEIGFYIISDGANKAFRVKAKSPCFTALSGFETYAKDMLVADVIATLGSIDIVLGEVDR